MKLITQTLEKRFKKIGSQQEDKDPIVIAKFFNPVGIGAWYAIDYDSETRNFFGYVSLFGDSCDEWGFFNLDELESIKGKFGLGIERDLYTPEQRISKFKISSLNK